MAKFLASIVNDKTKVKEIFNIHDYYHTKAKHAL